MNEKTLRSLIALAIFAAGLYLIYLAFHTFVGLKQLSEVGFLDILKILGLITGGVLLSMLGRGIENLPIFFPLLHLEFVVAGVLLVFLAAVMTGALLGDNQAGDFSETCYTYPLVRETSRPEISLSGILDFLTNALSFFGIIAILGIGIVMIFKAFDEDL